MADSEKIMGQTAAAVLWQALTFTEDADVHLLTDSGVENVNRVVDDFLAPLPIRRVLAQVEIAESNSMIEAFWKSLRHQWLYLHRLESIEAVQQLVDFYVTQHNAVVPHYAHHGQTPDEVYAGRPPIASVLAEHRARVRLHRIQYYRSRSCTVCRDVPSVPETRGAQVQRDFHAMS